MVRALKNENSTPIGRKRKILKLFLMNRVNNGNSYTIRLLL